ncbi:hypothetical protein ABIA35_009884 [Catenulispora sp. MAP12-49]|uniref:hypothetical protein n=1 Tax=unclassified Catenulispora TaxID=414885 RepID=UPI003518DC98
MEADARLRRFADWSDIRSGLVSGSINGLRPFYSSTEAYGRMDEVRRAINQIRTDWHRYEEFMQELRAVLSTAADEAAEQAVGAFDDADRRRMEALLSSRKAWLDGSTDRGDDFSAIQLYTSEDGYQRIYSVINAALRSDDLARDSIRLRAAAFLVELLTIDLYNYRLREPEADGYEGTVYRGMCVTPTELESFHQVVHGPIAERYVAIPLSMASATAVRDHALRFADEQAARHPGSRPLVWEIDVHGLDPELLGYYRAEYPSSVVTSICAVPIEKLSDYPEEREVLLRGAHLQLLAVAEQRHVSGESAALVVRAVMLNSNRDHLTAIASNEGADRDMRDLFRALILTHRARLCAEYAHAHSAPHDAAEYEAVAAEQRAYITSRLF